MLNGVMQRCQDYYDQIPGDTLVKIVKSALYSFTATLICSKYSASVPFNLTRSFFAAGVAALASFIYALTNPFFNKFFGDNRIVFNRELVKHAVNLALVSVLVNYLTTGKVNLFSINLFGSLCCNVLLASIEVIPNLFDFMGEPNIAQELRNAFLNLGIGVVSGSSSTFINFGVFAEIK